MRLHCVIRGKGAPILCLHGHPGSSQSLSVFTEHLSSKWQTFAPDLRGYGQSVYHQDFEISNHLEDLSELLDQYHLDQCLLLGWSLGGIFAIELALRYPKRFTGLILIASAAYPRSSHPAVSWPETAFAGVAGLINWVKPGWQWNIDTFARKSLLRYLIYQQTPSAYRYLAKDGTAAFFQTTSVAHGALNRALAKDYNRLADLSALDLPSLVLAGEQDRHITAESSKQTAERLRNCQWKCYPEVAHLFPWEIPDLVLADLDVWLEKHRLSSSQSISG